jgi:hypothetical protein
MQNARFEAPKAAFVWQPLGNFQLQTQDSVFRPTDLGIPEAIHPNRSFRPKRPDAFSSCFAPAKQAACGAEESLFDFPAQPCKLIAPSSDPPHPPL